MWMDVLRTLINVVKMFIHFRNCELHEARKGWKNNQYENKDS